MYNQHTTESEPQYTLDPQTRRATPVNAAARAEVQAWNSYAQQVMARSGTLQVARQTGYLHNSPAVR